MRQRAGERTRCRLLKTRRQQLAARCCGVKPNECRDKSRAASKNARGLTVRANGKRTALYESIWYDLNSDGELTANELKASSYSWTYDDVGRLTDEALDHWDDTFDQTDSFAFDLTGNRTRLERDHGNNGVDQVITYDFDANDRLLDEILDDLVDNSKDTTTTYAYDHTQQTSKTVTAASQTVSKQVFGYNLQGRMSSVVNEGYTSGTLSSRERTSYSYDSKSFRVELVTESGTATGTIANETWTLESSTSFLADAHNHTGYTQTIREVKTNADGTTETRDYTFGHDEIAQRVVSRDSSGTITSDQTHIFGHDGHGSVRILYDLAVAVSPIVQAMTFSAYGELLALHNNAGASRATTSRFSSLGYSGEHFDAAAQQQYLRARFYNPATGRFNRLDPFAGNMQDPQSLHKYAYVHGDPIGGTDPSGESVLASVSISVAIGGTIGAISGGAVAFNLGYDFDDPEFWLTLATGAIVGGLLGNAAIGGAAIVPILSTQSFYLLPALFAAGYFSIGFATSIRNPTASESNKIRDAVVFIGSVPGFYQDYSFLTQRGLFGPEFTFQVTDNLNADFYGKAFPHQNDTMVLRRDALDLPAPILASLIIHESVHDRQSIGTRLRDVWREPPAYSKQSQFMRAIGASGTQSQIAANLTSAGYTIYPVLQHWLTDQAQSFQTYGTPNPAVT